MWYPNLFSNFCKVQVFCYLAFLKNLCTPQNFGCFDVLDNGYLVVDLNLKHPFVVRGKGNDQIQLIKKLMKQDRYIRSPQSNNTFKLCGSNQTIVQGNVFLTDEKQSTLIIPEPDGYDEIIENLQCSIIEELFIFKKETSEVYETYFINDIKVLRKVASTLSRNKLIWHEDPVLVNRRSNFQGLRLKGIVEDNGYWAKVNSSFINEAPYSNQDEKFLVTNYVSGIVIDILNMLKLELNFTLDHYLRKDRQWGNVHVHPNGSTEGIGIVGDIYFGKADISSTTLTVTGLRFPSLDFLPSVEYVAGHLFIPKQQKINQPDLKTFYYPLSSLVWICMISTSCLIVIAIFFISKHQRINVLELAWVSFAPYFGGYFFTIDVMNSGSKIVLFVTLFCGNIVWMGYQASLTVDLSMPSNILPFSDFDSFSNSDWFLFTDEER